jgi:small subunit ribosomal protein S9
MIDTTANTGSTATAAPAEKKNDRFAKPHKGFWLGVGRRKSAVARVRIKPGEGKFLINDRAVDNFFTEVQYRADAVAPLKVTNLEGKIDVFVTIHGGGTTGQAGAVLMGLSRALKNYDSNLEITLRDNGFLTRDSREVERKKYGQAGARRRFQFSKR